MDTIAENNENTMDSDVTTETAAESTTTTDETADAPIDEVTKLQAEVTAEKNKYLYLYAEFENYKKRAIKERSDLVRYGHEFFARDLLQVKDNFERGLSHTENLESLVAGLKMVENDLQRTFERFNITTVKTVGEKFDPNLHEAVGQEEGDDGVILKEFLKGYSLNGRLLRPAKVIIGVSKK